MPAGPSAVAPSLATDLDGDGKTETVTAAPARGGIRIQVRDADGRKLADAKAPAPAGEVVTLALTSGPLGGAGAIVEAVAATDTLECRTFWRYRDRTLTPLPLRDRAGKPLADCASPAGWASRWEGAGGGRPAAWVRERAETVEAGTLTTREVYAFAGFSLDLDAARSAAEIAGVPIPAWYAATLYSRIALEILYSRFQLEGFRAEPTLTFDADRRRGVFAARLTGPGGELVAPVESYAAAAGTATLGVRAGDRTARVQIRLVGEGGTVPLSAVVDGFGPGWDRSFSPAGAWRGGARQVFPSAADELAVQYVAGAWSDPLGRTETFTLEGGGGPPYRLRSGDASFTVDLDGASAPFDALLLPTDARAGRAWGLTLRGPNAVDRVPAACAGAPPKPPCRADGEPETLRRIGARINVR